MAAVMPLVRANAADPVRLGMLRTLSPAPFYMAQERGYFGAEGVEVTFRSFERRNRSPPRLYRTISISVSPR
jgi:ABC-type nitrate/sulfonate/bicarbonate transport system substrate-binding protein